MGNTINQIKRGKMHYKKSQAALEFLTTYGWAFLIILVMISALAYFGILRPSRMLPERCTFSSEFECTDFDIVYDSTGGTDGTLGQVKFQLKNNVGFDILIPPNGVKLSTDSVDPYGCTLLTPVLPLATPWFDREFMDFTSTADCDGLNAQFSPGKKGKVLIELTYYKVGASTFQHTVHGEIYSNVR